MTGLDDDLERLLAPSYLDGLEERSLPDIRAMREDCQRLETKVSFLRRLAQGRLDVVHATLERRRQGRDADLTTVVAELSDIIGEGHPRPPGPGRLPMHMAPDLDDADLTAELDGVIDAEQIGQLPTMPEDRLQALVDALTEFESETSDRRRALHERIDRLQAEIVRRYKDGAASADALLT